MIRDPFVASAFRAVEDDGLAPLPVRADRPRDLDGGATARKDRCLAGRGAG
jgi:hypothetical protein